MRYVLGLSGKDSLCAALLIKAHRPELWERLEVFTTLTGCDYPETIAWLNCLPELLGKPIVKISGDLESIIASYTSDDRAFLPSQRSRYCTRQAKLQPFQKWLGGDTAILYTGIRADEARVGYKESTSIKPEFPLIEMGIDLGKAWMLILGLPEQYRPPTFYWPEIHELAREAWRQQSPLCGGNLDQHLSYAQKVVLMSGRSRPNCYFCFNQRRYEVVWLYEHRRELFDRMMAFEKPEYSWIKGFPLSELTEEKREQLKWDRACAIASSVAAQSFLDSGDGFETMPSCGLFCGK